MPPGPARKFKRAITANAKRWIGAGLLGAALSLGNPTVVHAKPIQATRSQARQSEKPKMKLSSSLRVVYTRQARDSQLPRISTATIQWQLNRINPNVKDKAAAIVEICEQYGVDSAYLVAKWNAESNCGKRGTAAVTKSIGNIRYTKRKPGDVSYTEYKGFRKYETIEAAVEDFCRLTVTYDQKHQLNTVAGITRRWTPSSENHVEQHQEHILSLMANMYTHAAESK